jgi:hypothetical protein
LDPRLRDSNEGLYYTFLKENGYDMNKTVKEFLKDMESRHIPYLDSIARASRRVQEDNPQLRGKLWKKRKKKSIEVKEEMRR